MRSNLEISTAEINKNKISPNAFAITEPLQYLLTRYTSSDRSSPQIGSTPWCLCPCVDCLRHLLETIRFGTHQDSKEVVFGHVCTRTSPSDRAIPHFSSYAPKNHSNDLTSVCLFPLLFFVFVYCRLSSGVTRPLSLAKCQGGSCSHR